MLFLKFYDPKAERLYYVTRMDFKSNETLEVRRGGVNDPCCLREEEEKHDQDVREAQEALPESQKYASTEKNMASDFKCVYLLTY